MEKGVERLQPLYFGIDLIPHRVGFEKGLPRQHRRPGGRTRDVRIQLVEDGVQQGAAQPGIHRLREVEIAKCLKTLTQRIQRLKGI